MGIEKGSAEKISQPETQAAVVERAAEAVLAAEEEAGNLDTEAQGRIDRMEDESGLPLGEIVDARRKTGLFDKLGSVAFRASVSAGVLRERFGDFLDGLARTEEYMGEVAPPRVGGMIPAHLRERIKDRFYPELDIIRILNAPKMERRERLRRFREKLAEQTANLARMQAELIRMLEANPDTPLIELFKFVEEKGDEHNFTGEQKMMARSALRLCRNRRDGIKSAREKYPRDEELFEAMVGKKPKGRIQIVERPAVLYIRCWDPDDYEAIYMRHHRHIQFSEAKKKALREDFGTFLYGDENSFLPELHNAVAAENSSEIEAERGEDSEKTSQKVMAHEEHHAIQQLFVKMTRRPKLYERIFSAEGQSMKEVAQRVESYLRSEREEIADNRARSEITAYLKEKRLSPQRVFEVLTRPKNEGGAYDWLGDMKWFFLNSVVAKEFVRMFGGKSELVLGKLAQKVYEDEYRALIRNGIDVFLALEKSGFTAEEAAAILDRVPLRDWGRAAKRLLEARPREKALEKTAGEQ